MRYILTLTWFCHNSDYDYPNHLTHHTMNIYDITVKKTNGEVISMSAYAGKVILIVNTATKCGLAWQFEQLETLWNTYSHDDLVILGFPCGQFADQEPETNKTMVSVCHMNFWVTFPLFAKIDVNGENTHPLYQYLKSEAWGILGDDIKWNFTKFLVDREWNVVDRYAPTTTPLSIKGDIEMWIEK